MPLHLLPDLLMEKQRDKLNNYRFTEGNELSI